MKGKNDLFTEYGDSLHNIENKRKVSLTDFYNFFFFPVFCLKDLKIFVPEAVITGNAAALTCEYELEHVRNFAFVSITISIIIQLIHLFSQQGSLFGSLVL